MSQPYTCIANLAEADPHRPTYLAIGVFDGVHLGHQYLLQQMVAAAHADNARPAVMTFFPHPRVFIQQLEGRYYLARLEDRLRLLAQQGVELIINQAFDEDFRRLRAAAFIDKLCQNLNMRQLWGGNFSLGYNREGNAEFLKAQGVAKGFTVREIHELVEWQGEKVSSSRIRRSLAEGQIEDVNGCLGHPFSITATVIHGDHRGRTINFPTANLAVWEQQLIPANGVYATYAWVHGQRYAAATNIGVRPTVAGSELRVEAHILDFADEIYDQELTLEFITPIRAEQKFPSFEALKNQIQADVHQVRQLLTPA